MGLSNNQIMIIYPARKPTPIYGFMFFQKGIKKPCNSITIIAGASPKNALKTRL